MDLQHLRDWFGYLAMAGMVLALVLYWLLDKFRRLPVQQRKGLLGLSLSTLELCRKEDGTTDRIEYVWGRDLSGSIGGAGGVGGLLYLKRNGMVYIPFYDAYGNVTGYWDETGAVVASFVYDAYGATLSASGPLADTFAIRYSTKYHDAESDLYYYGYRYYAPSLHRWLTRDPIAEEGGLNLYGFCGNAGSLVCDYLGLSRMLSGSIVPNPGKWGPESALARDVMRYIRDLNHVRDHKNRRCYRVVLRDFAEIVESEIKADVDRYGDDVYFIAHGAFFVNGYRTESQHFRRTGNESITLAYNTDGKGRMVSLGELGSKLNRKADVFS